MWMWDEKWSQEEVFSFQYPSLTMPHFPGGGRSTLFCYKKWILGGDHVLDAAPQRLPRYITGVIKWPLQRFNRLHIHSWKGEFEVQSLISTVLNSIKHWKVEPYNLLSWECQHQFSSTQSPLFHCKSRNHVFSFSFPCAPFQLSSIPFSTFSLCALEFLLLQPCLLCPSPLLHFSVPPPPPVLQIHQMMWRVGEQVQCGCCWGREKQTSDGSNHTSKWVPQMWAAGKNQGRGKQSSVKRGTRDERLMDPSCSPPSNSHNHTLLLEIPSLWLCRRLVFVFFLQADTWLQQSVATSSLMPIRHVH